MTRLLVAWRGGNAEALDRLAPLVYAELHRIAHRRTHFFAVSAQMMRRILVDAARRRTADKRGGDASHVALDEAVVPAREREADLVALDDALDRDGDARLADGQAVAAARLVGYLSLPSLRPNKNPVDHQAASKTLEVRH